VSKGIVLDSATRISVSELGATYHRAAALMVNVWYTN
jgi:hypothetical protein